MKKSGPVGCAQPCNPLVPCWFRRAHASRLRRRTGPDDETLEFPWAAPDSATRYHDLKRRPEALSLVEEAARFPELREFLAAVNSPTSLFETAKCDAWGTEEINPEEEIFGAPWKFGSTSTLFSRIRPTATRSKTMKSF